MTEIYLGEAFAFGHSQSQKLMFFLVPIKPVLGFQIGSKKVEKIEANQFFQL